MSRQTYRVSVSALLNIMVYYYIRVYKTSFMVFSILIAVPYSVERMAHPVDAIVCVCVSAQMISGLHAKWL